MSYLAIALIVFAVGATAGAVARHRRHTAMRAIDAGAVSQQWLAESKREEEA